MAGRRRGERASISPDGKSTSATPFVEVFAAVRARRAPLPLECGWRLSDDWPVLVELGGCIRVRRQGRGWTSGDAVPPGPPLGWGTSSPSWRPQESGPILRRLEEAARLRSCPLPMVVGNRRGRSVFDVCGRGEMVAIPRILDAMSVPPPLEDVEEVCNPMALQ